jgi:hypothetical protein
LHGGGQGFESPRLHSKNCSLILRSRIHRRLLRVVMPGTGWPKRWPPSPSESGRSSVRTGFDGRPQCLTTIGKSLGVSRERARQLEGIALKELRERQGELRLEGLVA